VTQRLFDLAFLLTYLGIRAVAPAFRAGAGTSLGRALPARSRAARVVGVNQSSPGR
jgi:hypothetical protein